MLAYRISHTPRTWKETVCAAFWYLGWIFYPPAPACQNSSYLTAGHTNRRKHVLVYDFIHMCTSVGMFYCAQTHVAYVCFWWVVYEEIKWTTKAIFIMVPFRGSVSDFTNCTAGMRERRCFLSTRIESGEGYLGLFWPSLEFCTATLAAKSL